MKNNLLNDPLSIPSVPPRKSDEATSLLTRLGYKWSDDYYQWYRPCYTSDFLRETATQGLLIAPEETHLSNKERRVAFSKPNSIQTRTYNLLAAEAIHSEEIYLRYWTDYPFATLGNISHEVAPIREIHLISYDRDKYVKVKVVGTSLVEEINSGYVYIEPVDYQEAQVQPSVISRNLLETLPNSRYED